MTFSRIAGKESHENTFAGFGPNYFGILHSHTGSLLFTAVWRS